MGIYKTNTISEVVENASLDCIPKLESKFTKQHDLREGKPMKIRLMKLTTKLLISVTNIVKRINYIKERRKREWQERYQS